jgi:hypothetical protein
MIGRHHPLERITRDQLHLDRRMDRALLVNEHAASVARLSSRARANVCIVLARSLQDAHFLAIA